MLSAGAARDPGRSVGGIAGELNGLPEDAARRKMPAKVGRRYICTLNAARQESKGLPQTFRSLFRNKRTDTDRSGGFHVRRRSGGPQQDHDVFAMVRCGRGEDGLKAGVYGLLADLPGEVNIISDDGIRIDLQMGENLGIGEVQDFVDVQFNFVEPPIAGTKGVRVNAASCEAFGYFCQGRSLLERSVQHPVDTGSIVASTV
jgi:hypothetical protein